MTFNLVPLGSDDDKNQNRYHYYFIHGVFGNFYKDVLDYFVYLYPRFDYTVVSTYSKAVEYLNKKNKLGRENDKPNLPALILNPSGEFEPADISGKQLHRYPNLAPGINKNLYEPIYQDKQMIIYPGFSRIKGEIEIVTLFDSFYEYADYKTFMIQIFGGLDRPIWPSFFNSYIIIPDELVNYKYHNEYEGITYNIDWESAGAYEKLIRSTNKTELVVPLVVKPIIKMTGMSDGSNRYGATDDLADWRLVLSLEFEVEMPTFMNLESDYLLENINFDFRFSSAFSIYNNENIPVNKNVIKTHYDILMDSTSNDLNYSFEDTTSEIVYDVDLVLKNRYVHIITQDEATSESNVEIQLEENIDDINKLIVNSKNGIMNYGSHYEISNENILVLKIDNMSLLKDQIIEIYIYE
jgi:hypothetical protein